MTRPRPRRWIAVVYALLLLLTLPWYWPANDVRHLFGFPLWVLAVMAALWVTACFTAWVYATSPDEDPD